MLHAPTHSVYTIGLMSGTSSDGINAVLWDTEQHRIIGYTYMAFPHNLQAALHHTVNEAASLGHCTIPELIQLSHTVTALHVQAVHTLLAAHSVPLEAVQAIGFHGYTLYHAPAAPSHASWQIGNPSWLAAQTGIPVVADFRQADIARGGQGAPLLPLFHRFIWESPDRHHAIVNIGGIANITYLPATQSLHAPLAWDTGPGNTLLDAYMRHAYQQAFDQGGCIAASGSLLPDLYTAYLSHPYFALPPPKSTGRECFHTEWMLSAIARHAPHAQAPDILATLLHLTAHTIATALGSLPALDTIWICGGGVHNTHLLHTLRNKLHAQFSQPIALHSTQVHGLDPDAVEAAGFAWLTEQFVSQRAVNTPPFTGAHAPCILGAWYPV